MYLDNEFLYLSFYLMILFVSAASIENRNGSAILINKAAYKHRISLESLILSNIINGIIHHVHLFIDLTICWSFDSKRAFE